MAGATWAIGRLGGPPWSRHRERLAVGRVRRRQQ